MDVIDLGRIASFVGGLALIISVSIVAIKSLSFKWTKIPVLALTVPLFGLSTGSKVVVDYSRDGFKVDLAKLEQISEENKEIINHLTRLDSSISSLPNDFSQIAKSSVFPAELYNDVSELNKLIKDQQTYINNQKYILFEQNSGDGTIYRYNNYDSQYVNDVIKKLKDNELTPIIIKPIKNNESKQ